MIDLIKLNFEKVPAHSGIIYNEEADQLAKRALLEQGYKTYKDGLIKMKALAFKNWLRTTKGDPYDDDLKMPVSQSLGSY